MRNLSLALTPLLVAACTSSAPIEEPKIKPTAEVNVEKTAKSTPTPPKLRLPGDVRPVRQSIELTLVPTQEIFGGKTKIDVSITQSTSVIWLNNDGLTIEKAEATVGKSTIPAKLITGDPNFVGLAFDEALPVGNATLSFVYRGSLLDKETDGISRQQEGNDWYIYSDFEPLEARRAFPSFDEPNYKIPWQLTLKTRKQDVALANTPPESTTDDTDGFKIVRFAETKPLPSYLVAFAVGPFDIVEAGKAGAKGTTIRVITPKGKKEWARYAAKTTGPVLDLLEKYFGSPYPYEKLDVISVPLQGGAMENPGLITFGQSIILSRPEEESASFRSRYAGICAHEIAHQWFGNLVTMAWWDDLWLNETFATWMAPKITEQLEPSWNLVAERAQNASNAMAVDSFATARRIRQPIESIDDIHDAFDGITYGKGAAVTRMFEKYIGEEKFRKGVQRYLREHESGNATAKEFLAAISAEAGQDISSAYSTFLDQPGVPMVSVELTCGAKPKLAFAQSRYLPEGAEKTNESPQWQIPVCVRWGAGKKTETKCLKLDKPTAEMELPACPDWVVANDSAHGYYRVSYSEELFKKNLKATDVLSAAERISFQSDVQALASIGKVHYGQVLDLSTKLADDKNPAVIESAMNPFWSAIRGPFFGENQRPKFSKLIRDVFGKRARQMGFQSDPKDDDPTREMRGQILKLVADEGGDEKLLAEATKLAKAWLADRKAVDPDMIQTVLFIAASHGDKALFDAFLAEAKKTSTERVDRNRLLRALGSFRNPAIMEKAFQIALDPAFDARESMPALWMATNFPETREQAYVFLKKNFDTLAERLPREYPGEFAWFGASLCDESRLGEVQAYFKDRSPKYVTGAHTLAQALEALRMCGVRRKAQTPHVEAFLNARK
jgi:cytosol alanyl aminopeptidase